MAIVKGNSLAMVKIKPGKWRESDIGMISEKRGIPVKEVRSMLAYNVVTVPQLALLSGLTESRVYNATNSVKSRRTGEYSSILTPCNPFPDNKGGKLFVLVDEKCVSFILKRL